MQIHKALASILALGMLFGCGGSSSKSSTPAPGTLNVYLGSDSIPGYDSVVVSVQKLEWSPDGGNWYPVGTVLNSYDLVQLQNGNGNTPTGVLVTGAVLAPTTITQWRITWDTTSNPKDPTAAASYVTLSNVITGSGGNLSMPATTIVPGKVNISSGVATRVELMITGAGAVQATGVSSLSAIPIYSFLNATGQAFDLATTCTLTGTLSSTVTSTPVALPYGEVYAETLVNGNFAIVRRSMTDAAGNYTLDALPAATASAESAPIYYVVSAAYNPVNVDFFAPQASAPFTATAPGVTTGATFATLDLAFPATATTLGAINATVTPASLFANTGQNTTDSTWAEVAQPVPAPAGQTTVVPTLIIRSTNAVTAASGDLIFIGSLPASVPYTVTAQRAASTAPGTLLASPVALPYANQVTLSTGITTPITFVYK
jgi:hypothetical protein